MPGVGIGRFLMWIGVYVATLGLTCFDVVYHDGLHIKFHRLELWGKCAHKREKVHARL